jgi:hypothetical protein
MKSEINSAACLIDLVDALRELITYTPVNSVTDLMLVRVLDGLVDYTVLLSQEVEFRLHARPPLRLVTNLSPKRSRRRRPNLTIGGGP